MKGRADFGALVCPLADAGGEQRHPGGGGGGGTTLR